MLGSKYTVLQLENQSYDIITYINFVKQDPPLIWHSKTPYLKPIILEFFQGIYFMVFGHANTGLIQFFTYNEREGFSSPRKPFNSQPKNLNSKMNESRGQILNQSMNQSNEREPIEPMITCFKYMSRSQTLAIGLHPNIGAGLATIMMEHQIFKFTNYKHFAIDSVLRNITP